MPLIENLKKVMIIGSGPIIIGQAAEFDYSGTQACKAIKEEGIQTVLVNSNPATIMTDTNMADKVYIQPLNIESLEEIIKKEKPHGILAGFGGQTALNLAMKLEEEGILQKYGVKLLGVNSETIKKAEDREEFKKLMLEIGEPIPKSMTATTREECEKFASEYGYPLIIRPAYTLGGTGGGIVSNYDELIKICSSGLESSPIGQILIEQSVAGWKEIEYEVIRDTKDNCMIVCNMENLDPVGVHTGDSIVVAPSQTLRDKQYQMLRQSAIKIIRSLKVEGGCNIQFALDPDSENYIVIEVNPRVSRSSALASKAAGYPIAKIGAKIAIGFSLDELKNYVTKNSSAFFEPALDYIVVKIPKWPFDKFIKASKTLGTQMKATGEVMAIDRTFESALLKAITCLEGKYTGLRIPHIEIMNDEELVNKTKLCDDERIFAIAEMLRRKMIIEEIWNITKIDKWFLYGIKNIVDMEFSLKDEKIDKDLLLEAMTIGFTNEEICKLTGLSIDELQSFREEYNIFPVYKMVDTCSGEFEASTPYYYSSYEQEDDSITTHGKKIIVVGSGPIRIGQGIEFDYCCVHGAWAIKDAEYESIIINNNPETVSTDFDIADKLYFESLFIDDVMNVIRKERPEGVIVQLGGQTSVNLTQKLNAFGVNILGTSFESTDIAEDRDKFAKFLNKLNIPVPIGQSATNMEEAMVAVESLGYPVIVRPSYVIGGRAMEVIYNEESLTKYLEEAVSLSKEYPVLIDKYVKGIEIEVDAVADGQEVIIPGIMEHVEKTGVHSGDSISIYPYFTLEKKVVDKLVEYTKKIVKELKVIGLINIQYVFDGKNIYVIEVNPRASRTVPILSKVTGIPMVKLAVNLMLGKKLKDYDYGKDLVENKKLYAVKVPVFSMEKLSDVDMFLGPEMKSTGEVLGVDEDFNKAVYKGFVASGINVPTKGNLYVSLKEEDKASGIEVIKDYCELGFNIFSSNDTEKILKENGIPCNILDSEEVINNIANKKLDIIISTSIKNNIENAHYEIRKKSIEYRKILFTSIDTAKLFLKAVELKRNNVKIEYKTITEYLDN